MGILSLPFEGMGLSSQLFLAFFSTWAAVNFGQTSGTEPGCCQKKTVGPNSYTLVDGETAPETFGCTSPCVYTMDMSDGATHYCFKSGDQPVTCTGGFTKITILNGLTNDVSGIVNVLYFSSNGGDVVSFPYTVDAIGETAVTLGSYVEILNITATEDGKASCDPLDGWLVNAVGVFGVFPNRT